MAGRNETYDCPQTCSGSSVSDGRTGSSSSPTPSHGSSRQSSNARSSSSSRSRCMGRRDKTRTISPTPQANSTRIISSGRQGTAAGQGNLPGWARGCTYDQAAISGSECSDSCPNTPIRSANVTRNIPEGPSPGQGNPPGWARGSGYGTTQIIDPGCSDSCPSSPRRAANVTRNITGSRPTSPQGTLPTWAQGSGYGSPESIESRCYETCLGSPGSGANATRNITGGRQVGQGSIPGWAQRSGNETRGTGSDFTDYPVGFSPMYGPNDAEVRSFRSPCQFVPQGQSSGYYPSLPPGWDFTTIYSLDDKSRTPTNYDTSSEVDSGLLRRINAGDVPHVIEFPSNYQFAEGGGPPAPTAYPGVNAANEPRRVIQNTTVTREGGKVTVSSRRTTESETESRISEEITESYEGTEGTTRSAFDTYNLPSSSSGPPAAGVTFNIPSGVSNASSFNPPLTSSRAPGTSIPSCIGNPPATSTRIQPADATYAVADTSTSFDRSFRNGPLPGGTYAIPQDGPNQYCPCPLFVQQGHVQRYDANVPTGSTGTPIQFAMVANASADCMAPCSSCDDCKGKTDNLSGKGSGAIQAELNQLETAEKQQLVDQLMQWQKLRRKVLTSALGTSAATNT